MENWPDMSNTGTGPGAGADGAFERFLTAALATIITIMFSWRLLVENESERGPLHAAFTQRQTMLTDRGASGSPGKKGDKNTNENKERDPDKYDRCSPNRDMSTSINTERDLTSGQEMTYGGHELMERKHANSYCSAAPGDTLDQGNIPERMCDKTQDMNEETNDKEDEDIESSPNPDEVNPSWSSYSWEDDVFGSIHTRRTARDFMTSPRTKSESSDPSYTAGSDSSDTDPGQVYVSSDTEESYMNREYRSIVDNDDYTNLMEVSSDSDSSESESGDYEPPMMDDSDDEVVNSSFSNVLEPIIEEDSDDMSGSSGDDEDENDDDDSNNKAGKLANNNKDWNEVDSGDDNFNEKGDETEINVSSNISDKCKETNIDDILKDGVITVSDETDSVITVLDETGVNSEPMNRDLREIHGNSVETQFSKHPRNEDKTSVECTPTEKIAYPITPVENVIQNQPSETDKSSAIGERYNTVADDTVIQASNHVALFTSEQHIPVGESNDNKTEIPKDLKLQTNLTRDKEIDYKSATKVLNLDRVDLLRNDMYNNEDADDSLPASPIRTCALDDLNDGYISDESCSSASVVTIVSLRNYDDDHNQTSHTNEVNSNDVNGGKNVGMEKSGSVIHIPQLTGSPEHERESGDVSDGGCGNNKSSNMDVDRERTKTPEFNYCDFVKEIEANSEERIESVKEQTLAQANDGLTGEPGNVNFLNTNDVIDNCRTYEVENVNSGLDVSDVALVKEDNDTGSGCVEDNNERYVVNDFYSDFDNGYSENGRGSPRRMSSDEPYFSSSQSEDSEGPREYNPYDDDFAEFHLESESDEDTFFLVMDDNSQLRKLETVTNLDSIGLSPGTKVQESEDGKSVVFSKTEELFTDHRVKYYIKDRGGETVGSLPTFDCQIKEESELEGEHESEFVNGVLGQKQELCLSEQKLSDAETRRSSESVTCDLANSRASETSSDTDLHACSSLSDNVPVTDSSSSELLHTDLSPWSSHDQQLDTKVNKKPDTTDESVDLTILESDLHKSVSEPVTLNLSEQDLTVSDSTTAKDQISDSHSECTCLESKSSESLNVPLHIDEEQDSGIQCSSSLSPDMGQRTPSSDDVDDVLQDEVILDSLSRSRDIEQAYTCNTSTSIEDNSHLHTLSLALDDTSDLQRSVYNNNKNAMPDRNEIGNVCVPETQGVRSAIEIVSLDKSPSGSMQNIDRLYDVNNEKVSVQERIEQNVAILSLESSPFSRRRHLGRHVEDLHETVNSDKKSERTTASPVDKVVMNNEDINDDENTEHFVLTSLGKSQSSSRGNLNECAIDSLSTSLSKPQSQINQFDTNNDKTSKSSEEARKDSKANFPSVESVDAKVNNNFDSKSTDQPVAVNGTDIEATPAGIAIDRDSHHNSAKDKLDIKKTDSTHCPEDTMEALEDVLSPCIEHMSMTVDQNKLPQQESSVVVPLIPSLQASSTSQENQEMTPLAITQSRVVRTSAVRPSSIKRSGSGVVAKIAKQQQIKRSPFRYSSVLQEPVVVENTPYVIGLPDKHTSISRMKIRSSRQRFLSADNLTSDQVIDPFAHYKTSISSSLPRQRRYARKDDANPSNHRRHLSYEHVDHITSLYASRDQSFQSDDSFEKPEIDKLHKNCIFSPHIHDEILNTTHSIDNLGLHEQLMRYGSMTSLIETDLDTGETYETRLADFDLLDFQHLPLQRTASMSDLEYKHRMESRKPTKGRFADRNMPKSKSLMALETDIDDAMTRPGEGNLQRVPSVHELRVAKSLQKLNVPDWYKKSSVSRSGSTYSLLSERRDSTSTLSSIGYAQSILSAPCPSLSPTNNAVVIRTRVTPTTALRLMRSTPRLPITPEKSPLPPTSSFRLPSDKFRNREKPKELMPIPVVPFAKLRLMFELPTSGGKKTDVKKTPSMKSQPRSPETPVAPSQIIPSDVPPMVTITTPESAPTLESTYEKVESPPNKEPVYENVDINTETVKNGKVRIQEPEVKRQPPPVPEKPKHLSKSGKESQKNKEQKRSFFPHGLRMPKLSKQKSPTHKAVTSEQDSPSQTATSEPISVPSTKSRIETTV